MRNISEGSVNAATCATIQADFVVRFAAMKTEPPQCAWLNGIGTVLSLEDISQLLEYQRSVLLDEIQLRAISPELPCRKQSSSAGRGDEQSASHAPC